ncbi:MAG TPA: hypothetical protein VEC35_16385, partial [Noviherbaspirillum sp.]|nr:hypothetical protein [Noviherbaspirillum sp.]
KNGAAKPGIERLTTAPAGMATADAQTEATPGGDEPTVEKDDVSNPANIIPSAAGAALQEVRNTSKKDYSKVSRNLVTKDRK